MLSKPQRERAFNIIIATQCLGMLTTFLFQNGFYLNYFTKLGFSSSAFALFAALPALVGGVLILPLAYYSDRFGKLRLALFGQLSLIGSLVVMMMAGWGAARFAAPLVATSLLVFCLGSSLQGASWFALLNPIIPAEIRGRFFGRLRVSFLTVNIVFATLVSFVMKHTRSMAAFQALLALILLAHVARYFTYARIPELEREHRGEHAKRSFWTACAQVFAIPGYIAFNGYVFLITLFTAGVPIVFGLMQKDVFAFSAAKIMMVGNFFLGGAMAGCALGGRAVDRFGTRVVFLLTHVAYALIIVSMLARHWTPWPIMGHVVACSFLFSMTAAIAGVAVSSEALALIPATNKSLSTAVHMSLVSFGVALSGVFVSRAIGWDMLASEWTLLERGYTAYDSILLGFAVLTVLMLATIGLVPKVVKQARFMPGGGYPRV